jgi:hypothetical protein
MSPVIASFFMEDFKEVELSKAAYKPMWWFHYAHDLVSWATRAEEFP